MAFQDIIDFSGGINTAIAPMKIAENEAVVATSCEIQNGTIFSSSVPLDLALAADINTIYYTDKSKVVSSAEDRFYVEFGGFLYWTNSAGTMKRYDGTTTSDIGGWTKPTTAPNAVASATVSTMVGDYLYAYTYMYASSFESPPSPFKAVSAINKTGVAVSFVDTPPATATSRVLYRLGGVVPTFRFVADIPIATTTYTDVIADTNIDPYELVSFDNEPPISGLDMLIENSGTFFASKLDKLYFSRQGTPEYWYAYNYVDLPANITGIGKIGSSLIVWTSSEMFMVNGADLNTISLTKLQFQYGCDNKRTICNLKGMLIWVSKVAGRLIVCAYDGQDVTVISDKHRQFDMLGNILNSTYDNFTNETYESFSFTIIRAITYNNKYYLLTNIGIYIFDFNNGFRIYLKEYKADSIFIKDTSLIAIKSGAQYHLNASFGASENFIYKTGEFTNGSMIAKKTYRRVRIRGKGTFTTTILIDGNTIFTSAENSFYIQAESVGTSIQFLFKSTGFAEISGISYEYEVLAL